MVLRVLTPELTRQTLVNGIKSISLMHIKAKYSFNSIITVAGSHEGGAGLGRP
jgi:hypothetical protein